MNVSPQWVAIVVSAVALFFALRRDTRNASKVDVDDLRRERDECLARLSMMEGQVAVVREDNLDLMRKLLGMPGDK